MWNPFISKPKQKNEEIIEIKEEKHRLYDILFTEVDRAGPESVLKGLLQACTDWWQPTESIAAKSQGRLVCVVIMQVINMVETINNERFKLSSHMSQLTNNILSERYESLVNNKFDKAIDTLIKNGGLK